MPSSERLLICRSNFTLERVSLGAEPASAVMRGLVPRIHVLVGRGEAVDGRHRATAVRFGWVCRFTGYSKYSLLPRPSWPDLFRFVPAIHVPEPKKGVDHRDEPGDDDERDRGIALHCNRIRGTGQPWRQAGHDGDGGLSLRAKRSNLATMPHDQPGLPRRALRSSQ